MRRPVKVRFQSFGMTLADAFRIGDDPVIAATRIFVLLQQSRNVPFQLAMLAENSVTV